MIDFDDVTMIYKRGARPALSHVTTTIERGEFVFLVGKSGSGKSTFMSMIHREYKPTSGIVTVLGQNVNELSRWKVPKLRRQIGTVFQDFRLLENKSIFNNIALAMQVIGKSRHEIKERVPVVLELVGLGDKAKRMPYELSGGEQQRVAIARAMVNRPQILIADEPTGNLDPNTSLGIMQLLNRINRAGTTIIMATHDDEIVNQLRKRVIELVDGKIIRDQDRGVYGSSRS